MKRATLTRIGVMAGLAAAVAVAAQYRQSLDAETLSATLRGFGIWAPILFVALFALATVAFLPGMVFALAGGALFGPWLGTLYNLAGATAGAVLAFLAARHVASSWVRERTGPRLGRIVDGVEREGWRFVALTRLVPLFPFNLLNYAFGLTRIPLLEYTAATAICMAPGALAYTYLGYAGREAVAGGESAIRSGLVALALLAVAVSVPRLAKRMRAAKAEIPSGELRRRLQAGEDILVVDVRDAEDYLGNGGHVPGARNIPLAELQSRLAELEPWRRQPLALVCRTNRKSGQAAELLRAEGFGQVLVIADGMVGWSANGFATEQGGTPPDAGADTGGRGR